MQCLQSWGSKTAPEASLRAVHTSHPKAPAVRVPGLVEGVPCLDFAQGISRPPLEALCEVDVDDEDGASETVAQAS